jgi:hypothetical protein
MGTGGADPDFSPFLQADFYRYCFLPRKDSGRRHGNFFVPRHVLRIAEKKPDL